MAHKAPALRLHKSGQWFVRWGGRDRYLGRDHAAAQERYLSDLTHGLPGWSEWRRRQTEARRTHWTQSAMTVLELQRRFLDNRAREVGPGAENFYRSATRRFVLAFGGDVAAQVRVIQLQAIKDQMLRDGFAPKTINHDIQAVQTMFRWAADLEYLPTVNLRGCHKLPEGEVVDRSLTKAQVHAMLAKADTVLRPWLAVTYLCAMRPIETVRAVNGQGEWVGKGVLKLPNKAWRKVKLARHVLFSAEALAWFAKCEPRWSRVDSFGAAAVRQCGRGSHPLRHSAATHLLAAGVPRADADEILGHYPRRVSLVYMQPRWQALRRLVGRLTLRIPASRVRA